jgi:hypothetical protein
MNEPPAIPEPVLPRPVLCVWSIACEMTTADLDQNGSIDGDDVWMFFSDWSDCNRVDRTGAGCPSCDNDGDGVCDACDVIRFFNLWERGG